MSQRSWNDPPRPGAHAEAPGGIREEIDAVELDQEGRVTDPGDGRGVMVPAKCADVGHRDGKRSKRVLTVQPRGESQEIESDARPVRRAPEVRVEIPEGAVQTGRAKKLAVASSP